MKDKKSNIELLRIILFIMVVVIHITRAGILDPELRINFGGYNWIYAITIRTFAAPAVIVFVLITGYLKANKEIVSIKKNILRLLEPFIVYLPIYCLVNIIAAKSVFTGIGNTLKYLSCFTGDSYHLWYIVAYIGLMLLAPYINNSLKKCSQKQYKQLAIILLTMASISCSLDMFFNIAIFPDIFDAKIILFIALYVIGGYFGKYGIKVSKWTALLGYITISAFSSLIILRINNLYMQVNLFSKVNNITSILSITSGVLLFCFFMKLDFENKIINYIGGLTYGAYIVHVYYIDKIQVIFPSLTHTKESFYFLYNIAFLLIVFIVSLSTEAMRSLIFREKNNVQINQKMLEEQAKF